MTIADSLGPDGRRPQLYGVRGWLLFLCITLIVFLPLQVIILAWGAFQAPNFLAVLPVLIVISLLNGFGIIVGAFLYRERPVGVLLAKIFFGLRIALTIPALLQGISLVALIAVGQAVAWLIYLFRSERVRNTYAKDTARDAAEIFR